MSTELTVKTEDLSQKATTLLVTDQASHAGACEFLKSVTAMIKEVKDHYKDPKDKAFAAHKAICAAEKKHLTPLEQADKLIRQRISNFVLEEQRKAKEEQARIEAENRKREEEAKLKQAEELEKAGMTEEAERVINEEIVPVAVAVAPKIETNNGVSYVDNWTFEITEPNLIPRQFLIPNEKAIGAYVKAMKSEAKIAGVKVFNNKTVKVRA